jgi:anti-sigma regulatory factor (Ser/Thr protein kinase)
LKEAQASFPAQVGSATAARDFVERVLQGWGRHGLVEDARLLVSELVINAVVHAGSVSSVHVDDRDGTVRVEVRDESPLLPEIQPFSPSAPSGRGLMIVSALADSWGVDAAEDHKVVWFELVETNGHPVHELDGDRGAALRRAG